VKWKANNQRARSWVVDYSAARARAIEWLGDRYLLAKPLNANEGAWRKAPRLLLHPAPGAAEPVKRSS
jgi:hypothetical protein